MAVAVTLTADTYSSGKRGIDAHERKRERELKIENNVSDESRRRRAGPRARRRYSRLTRRTMTNVKNRLAHDDGDFDGPPEPPAKRITSAKGSFRNFVFYLLLGKAGISRLWSNRAMRFFTAAGDAIFKTEVEPCVVGRAAE